MQTERFQTTQTRTREIDAGLRQHMLGVYNKMTAGVLVTAITAWLVSTSPMLMQLLLGGPLMTVYHPVALFVGCS